MLEFTVLALAFILGSIPFGLILMQLLENRDPRNEGSGNIGMSNVMRLSGTALGGSTFLLDAGKGCLAVWLASETLPETWQVSLAMILVVVGHCYSCFLNFQGGKGVATAGGAVLALAWQPFGWLILIWASMRFLSERSDIASMTAAAALPYLAHRFIPLHFWPIIGLCVLIIWRHRRNFKGISDNRSEITKSILQ